VPSCIPGVVKMVCKGGSDTLDVRGIDMALSCIPVVFKMVMVCKGGSDTLDFRGIDIALSSMKGDSALRVVPGLVDSKI
jgi:hypothetical protein